MEAAHQACLNQSSDIFDDFNFSSHDQPRYDRALDTTDVVKIVCYALVFLGSLCGNLAIIITVAARRRLSSVINAYLANLAVADLCILFFCMWVHLVKDLSKERHYPLGAFWCRFNGFAQMTSLTASVLTLTSIACDRFVAVIFPLRARRSKTGRRLVLIIFLIWTISAAAALPLLLFRRLLVIQWHDGVENSCLDNWPVTYEYSDTLERCQRTHYYKHMYQTVMAVLLFFAPILVMGVAYALIIWRLWVSPLPQQEGGASQVHHQNYSKKRVVKMVVALLAVFVVCWLPLQITSLYAIFVIDASNQSTPSWYGSLQFLAYFLAYSNSLWNPILYGGFNYHFRQGLRRLLPCRGTSPGPGYSSRTHRSRTRSLRSGIVTALVPLRDFQVRILAGSRAGSGRFRSKPRDSSVDCS